MKIEEENPEWKIKNKEYIKEVQIFLDKADNIENKELKEDLIYQMLRCDKLLTKLAQKEIEKNKM